MLKLTRPICFLDIEATGLDVAVDRIVSLAITKILPDGSRSTVAWKFNPGVVMCAEVIAIHGITNEDVAGCPPFYKHHKEIYEMLLGCDVGGFNVRNFDVSILWEEFYRCGVSWDVSEVYMVDAGAIFKKFEPRTLTAAVKFYCDREHVGAHAAASDVSATMDVLGKQIARYNLADTVPELVSAGAHDDDVPRVDLAGKIVLDKDGDPCYSFGKTRFDRTRRVGLKLKDDQGLARWMLGKDFPMQTQVVVKRIMADIERELADEANSQSSMF